MSDFGLLATMSASRIIRIWNWRTGLLLRTLPEQRNTGALAAIGSDYLASGGTDKTVSVWNWRTGRLERTLPSRLPLHWTKGEVHCLVALGSDCLASGSGESDGFLSNGMVWIWDWRTGALRRILSGHTDFVCALVELGDTFLASSSADRTIRVWNWKTGAPQYIVRRGHTHAARALAKLGDLFFASGSDDTTIRIWNWQTGRAVRTLAGHTGAVSALAALGDDFLLSASHDRNVLIWDWRSGAPQTIISNGHSDHVLSVACLRQGHRPLDAIATGTSGGSIRVWHPPS